MRGRFMVGIGVAVMALAACGGGSSKAFNSADVTFAQSMIPHHEQAVEMATLAATQAVSPAVKDLAARIRTAQAPEIQHMSGWLQSWGQPVSAQADGSDMAGMDHGDGSSGMMTSADMDRLTAATGSAFDRLFLTMMVTHHQGAITMAQTETQDGKFANSKRLASTIITAQQAEIMEMQQLLST
jgi:uncharacterized protein (DUF305 family)